MFNYDYNVIDLTICKHCNGENSGFEPYPHLYSGLCDACVEKLCTKENAIDYIIARKQVMECYLWSDELLNSATGYDLTDGDFPAETVQTARDKLQHLETADLQTFALDNIDDFSEWLIEDGRA